jgi:uncharacterized protein YbjT (DUF2867 family)
LDGRFEATCEIVRGDVLDQASLRRAMQGVDVAYYLVHAMAAAGDFRTRDREAAGNFARAARDAGVGRIVYLGGLGHEDDNLSPHLASRHEVGVILRGSGVPTVELRASIIIGSGSLSFELIRALVERLPVMITPRWVSSKAQPIAVEDVIAYLDLARHVPIAEQQVVEIGGADQVSYGEIMREYARQRGLRRLMIPVPLLTPRLSSLWLGLVTPLYARIGKSLIDSVRHDTVVRDAGAHPMFPIRPRGIREAIARALVHEDAAFAQTRWVDALSSQRASGRRQESPGGPRIVDSRVITVKVPPPDAFAPIRRIGGQVGWYAADWLWRLRGFLDLLVGGPGSRRGRRDPESVRVGDAVDFWRVEAFEPDRLLRLAAEMHLPGRAWLQFEVEPEGDGSVVRQTAIFDARGAAGLLYWYLLYPLHVLVFRGMLRGIARAAEKSPMRRKANI